MIFPGNVPETPGLWEHGQMTNLRLSQIERQVDYGVPDDPTPEQIADTGRADGTAAMSAREFWLIEQIHNAFFEELLVRMTLPKYDGHGGRRNCRKIMCLEPEKEFDAVADAARWIGCVPSSLHNAMRLNGGVCKGKKFRYVA